MTTKFVTSLCNAKFVRTLFVHLNKIAHFIVFFCSSFFCEIALFRHISGINRTLHSREIREWSAEWC